MNTEVTKRAVPNLKGSIKRIPTIDKTLTRENCCADAKVVGDKFVEHSMRIDDIDPHFAENVGYDNVNSGLNAANVQEAIDKMVEECEKMVEEYENPPMMLWAEYRTREKWMGKPVYTKLISAKYDHAIGNEGGSYSFAIEFSTPNLHRLVRYSGCIDGANQYAQYSPHAIPLHNNDGGSMGVDYMNLGGLALAMEKFIIPANTEFFIQLWYTKTTD